MLHRVLWEERNGAIPKCKEILPIGEWDDFSPDNWVMRIRNSGRDRANRVHPVQSFEGIRFQLNPKTGYYKRAWQAHDGTREVYMHRFVWVHFRGPIPDGFEIHHKDENKANNDISNLQMVTGPWHRSFHQSKRLMDPEYQARNRAFMEKIRPLASKWHGSPEGLEWHRLHGLNMRKRKLNGTTKETNP